MPAPKNWEKIYVSTVYDVGREKLNWAFDTRSHDARYDVYLRKAAFDAYAEIWAGESITEVRKANVRCSV